MIITFNTLSDINSAADEFLNATAGNKHFAFYGSMGAGKTTFIKALCQKLNVIDVVASPTFAIINEYHTSDNNKIFHFDFYRIKDIEEVYNIGYEDYFYSNNYCFLEWPELVEELLPEHVTKVRISEAENGTRIIELDVAANR